jgi:hypothetical protein
MRRKTLMAIGLAVLLGVSLQAAAAGLFTAGQRVVLLQDNPPGAVGLLTGRGGTVVCGDSNDYSGNILVSWDFWNSSKPPSITCPNDPGTLYPANSVSAVDPNQVLLGVPFNKPGTISKTPAGCVYLTGDNGKIYNLQVTADEYAALGLTTNPVKFGDHVKVLGLLNTTPPTGHRVCPQQDGDVYWPIIVPNPVTVPTLPSPIAFNIGGNPISLVVDPNAPGPGYTFAGCTNVVIESNFQAMLFVQVTPAPGVGGTWTTTITPNIAGPGTVTVTICVQVTNLDLSTLPPMGSNVQVATVTLSGLPYP